MSPSPVVLRVIATEGSMVRTSDAMLAVAVAVLPVARPTSQSGICAGTIPARNGS